jgi:hypothetical protein
MPLSEPELREWLEELAPSNKERRSVIIDLVRNANKDSMSLDDRIDCQRALKILDGDVPERAGPRTINPTDLEPEIEH